MMKLSKHEFAASAPLPYRYPAHSPSVSCTLAEKPAEYNTMVKKNNTTCNSKDVAHVLIVEDNKLNQRVMQMMLINIGCEVVVVGSSRLAIEACKKHSFDLVFMDVGLPDVDGMKTAAIIHNELGLKDLPIIGITAHIVESEIGTSEAEHLNDIHLKPISSTMFQELLTEWVPSKHKN